GCEAQDRGVHRMDAPSPSLTGRPRSIKPVCSTTLDRLSPHDRMLTHIHTEADLNRALTALGRCDPRFADLINMAGQPPLRRPPHGFPGAGAGGVGHEVSRAAP